MKRLFVIMIVGLLMGSHSIAQKTQKATQKRESCIPYKFSRTIEEFRSEILYGHDPFIWKQLWPEYARLVNRGLKSSKDSVLRAKVLGDDQGSMEYIMSHSFEYDSSFADWRDFSNGTRVDDNLQYTNLKGLPSHWVGFKDKDVEIIYAKLACANPEDDKNPPTPYIPPVLPPAKPEPKKEFKEDLPSFADVDEIEKKEDLAYDEPKKEYPPVDRRVKEKRPIKIHIGIGLNFGGGYSSNGRFFPQQGYDPRTMPISIPAVGSGGNGGLDAPTRNMPFSLSL